MKGAIVAYRTKVRIVEAFRWVGQSRLEWPEWATPQLLNESGRALYAYTKNGPVRVESGDWCILGDCEIYPCTDEEFRKRYEEDNEPVMKIQVAEPPYGA